jgi:hypothetical protein
VYFWRHHVYAKNRRLRRASGRARITEVRASHLSMLSKPDAVERVILDAVRSSS